MQIIETETEKEERLATEIRLLNKQLLDFKGLPEDWHEKNETQRMKRSDLGRYINKKT